MSDYRDEVRAIRTQISILRQRLQIEDSQLATFGLYCPAHLKLEAHEDFTKLRHAVLEFLRYELDPIIAEESTLDSPWLRRIYSLILGVARPTGYPALKQTLPLDLVREIYHVLLTETDHGFVNFARFIAAVKIRYPRLNVALDPWVERLCNDRVLPLTKTDFETNPDTYRLADVVTLLIAVRPDHELIDYYTVQGWLWFAPDKVKPLPVDATSYPFNKLETAFWSLYETAFDEEPTLDEATLRVDVFLDGKHLDVPIHRWTTPEAPPIGQINHVMVRSFERTFVDYPRSSQFRRKARLMRSRWIQRWHQIGHWNQRFALNDHDSGDNYREMMRELTVNDACICVVEACRLYQMDRTPFVDSGIPIGVWFHAHTNPLDCYHDLDPYIAQISNIHELPHHLLQDRKVNYALAEQVVLFWDDPDRRPYRIEDPTDTRVPRAEQP